MHSEIDLLRLSMPAPHSPRVQWGQLYGAAQSLAVAHAANSTEELVCVVTSSAAGADRLERELEFFMRDKNISRFSDYETLPYDAFSPPPELIAERLATLSALASGRVETLIVNSQALLTRLPPPEFIAARSITVAVGEQFDRESMCAQLVSHGYLNVEKVVDPGEFAVRGSLLDIYPTGAELPVRIDLFDDEIESLRLFNPESQLTSGETQAVRILPAREFPFDSDAIRQFRDRFRQHLPGEPNRAIIYRDISEAQLPAGIEYYLPLFFDVTSSLFDHLPKATLFIFLEDAIESLESGWTLIKERHEQLTGDIERPILNPEIAFWPPETLRERLPSWPSAQISARERPTSTAGTVSNAGTAHPLSESAAKETDPIGRWLPMNSQSRTLVVTSSPGRREVLGDLLRGRGLEPVEVGNWEAFLKGEQQLSLAVADLDEGLSLPDQRLRIITAEQLGADRPRQRNRSRRRRGSRDPDAIVQELTDLRVGAPVVHEEYGVGRYLGLKMLAVLEIDAATTEYLLLEYAGGDKLYVPVYNLHLITRYTGASPEQAPLHRLGSDQWEKAKRKAAKQVRDVAAELLGLYAQRAARRGVALPLNEDIYQRFALEFPFEETKDQLEAVQQVIGDLANEQPMDRVICGDVGFGKTEVALRAAFVTAHAGYQVAVLVPTTLLAQQHHRTFSDRFADWPVRVELLSRFRSSKDSRAVLSGLQDGTVDIVIGTHKLFSSDIQFKQLGLVIVDEEHRFGVRHKEKLKKLRADVDILTLTATPIPRTLNMALGGLRDLSLIATPPADRLSVKTFVGEWSNQAVREAVLREIRRGGQIYFIHNRVQDIDKISAKLSELLPEATIGVAHGQMSERALEDIMLDFYHRRFNLLLCTTIIESGIDVPTANTIIINRADRLGLAQLHQLRGRVGRSHHQAYAYLIAPPTRLLTADAAKRLEAIEALEDLGSGFTLATHDLEIRGAGELLGDEQSGQIQAIGFSLYNDLLSRAVASLRAGDEPDLEDSSARGTEIELGLPALIPDDYMPDVHMRLVHYKRIASAVSASALRELQVELIDRFGLLPEPIQILFEVTRLKLLAEQLGITKIQAENRGGTLRFSARATIDPLLLVTMVEDRPDEFSLEGPYKLRFRWDLDNDAKRIDAAELLLTELGAKNETSAAA
jgi:transcription-repair coupling factor (superfamily II helicase)